MPPADPWSDFPDANPDADGASADWSAFPDANPKKREQHRKQPEAGIGKVTGAVDGDTLTLSNGANLRVWGIDAPELNQPGFDRDGKPVAIGKNALASLDAVLANAQSTIGEQQGASYGRPVAPVSVDGEDLGLMSARSGYALAAPDFLASDPQRRFEYMQAERLARQNGLGMHQTRQQRPEQFRRDPIMVDMPERQEVARFWDDPTPFSGMRPEVEAEYIRQLNDHSIPLEQVLEFARANGFMFDLAKAAESRAIARKAGEAVGIVYKDRPKPLTDLGDGATGAYVRGVGNSILPNMLEETGAIADTLLGTPGRESVWISDRRLADIWQNNYLQNEAITGFDAQAHPGATLAGELTGALVPIARIKNAADLAKFGAGYGVVAGLGQDGSIPERLESGVIGGGLGLVTSVVGGKLVEKAAPYVAKGVSKLGNEITTLGGRYLPRQERPVIDVSAPSVEQAGVRAMDGEAPPAISQDMSYPTRPDAPEQPYPLSLPMSDAQRRAASESVTPGDILPIPANEIGSIEEAAAKDAGRFAPAKAPDEKGALERQTVRAWNGAPVPKVGPIDLVGWLRLNGGLRDEGGELTHMGLTNAARRDMDFVGQETRFGPLVNNQGGMNFDDAALRAWEAGYFPDLAERPTVNEFLDAMRGTQEGWRRHFLPDDAVQIERFNAMRDERVALDRMRSETGEEVWVDRSSPADDQPFPPVSAYEEWPAGGPDFAGNINLNKLDSPQDIKRALAFSDRRVGFDAATRGRVSQAETEKLASELGMSPEQLLSRRKGQALNAEEALAARQILAKSGNELVNAARRLREAGDDPGSELLAGFRQKWLRHVAIQEQVSGATAEAGRALAQFKMLASSRSVRGDVLSAMVEGSGGGRRLQDAADILIDAVETAPGKFNALTEQLARPRFKDKAVELYYNMMLSGPRTHVVNVTSNTLTALGQLPEHAVAAGLGKVRELAARGAVDRVTATEVGRRSFGLLQGFKEGLAQFARTARTGETSDLVSNVESQTQEAIPGTLGKIVRTPSRLLAAEDELFKAVARRMEINGLAARMAHKEGLKGEAAAKRIAELVEMPTPEMLDRAFDYGRYLTFQRPLGEISGGVARMRNANGAPGFLMTMLVPFVRTPVNLLKFAGERSPAAPMLKEWRADFKAGGARRDLAAARALVGTAFAATIYEAAINGRVTGSRPDDQAKAQFMNADGWQPYSFKVGDKWYSYARLDPFSTTIGVAADLATKKDGMTPRQLDDQAMLLTASIMKNMGDKTWLSGASDFLQAISDPMRYGPSYLRKQAASLATPALSAQVAGTVDPVARDQRSVSDAIKARVPGMSSSLPAKRNIWGEPIENEGGLGPDLISPIWSKTDRNDPVNAEMLRVGARFQPPERFVKIDGQRVDLTPQQYERYAELAGQGTRRRIEQLMAQPTWKGLSDLARASAAGKAATAAKAEARNVLFGGEPAKAGAGSGEAATPGDDWTSFPDVEQEDIAGALQRAIPGIGLASGYRTPAYQEDMKRRGYRPADNSAHLDGSSLDLTPPPGKSLGWLRSKVMQHYPNARFRPEGDHLHTTFPGWYGAPVLGGAKAAGLVNPNAGR